ncbi:hypothetical protein ACFWY5_18955 [Nonomuraea sp. NPDC059007]|uniref:hypothetical protein n=1 Tax=Nonomuraea sp. NPDC059007 TaxID=3346692 RepID=UPI00368B4A6E
MVDRDRERRTGSEITPVRVDVEVRQVTAEHVTFTQDLHQPGMGAPRGELEHPALPGGGGLEIEAQYGDWNRGPLTGAAPEIITFAAG